MTLFDDLDDAELLALTPEQKARYIDIECLEAGAGLLPPAPGERPSFETATEDTDVFSIGTMLFTDRTEAQHVLETLNACRSTSEYEYIKGRSYKKVLSRKPEPFSIHTERYFSQQHAATHANVIAEQQVQLAAWQEQNDEYRRIADKRAAVMTAMEERFDEAARADRRRTSLRREYERILLLTDGNRRTAARFLKDQHPVDAERFLPEAFTFNADEPPGVILSRKSRLYTSDPAPEADLEIEL